MAIPDYQSMMLPVLKLASEGKEHILATLLMRWKITVVCRQLLEKGFDL